MVELRLLPPLPPTSIIVSGHNKPQKLSKDWVLLWGMVHGPSSKARCHLFVAKLRENLSEAPGGRKGQEDREEVQSCWGWRLKDQRSIAKATIEEVWAGLCLSLTRAPRRPCYGYGHGSPQRCLGLSEPPRSVAKPQMNLGQPTSARGSLPERYVQTLHMH